MVKIGLIGCGRISEKHFDAIQQLPELCQLTATCDIKKTDASLHNQYYKNFSELLKDPNIDLVSICTPSGLHAEQAIEAMKAGKHVITEKPMAIKFIDGLKMVSTSEQTGKKLFVVKQNRLNPTLQMLKRAVTEGRFGKIYSVAVNVFWQRPQSYYDLAPWRGTWALDGGALMNRQVTMWIFSLGFLVPLKKSVPLLPLSHATLKQKTLEPFALSGLMAP